MSEPSRKTMQFKDLGALRQAAVKHHQDKDLETARDLYRVYLENRPKDGVIWSNLGALFRAQKNFEMAVACQRRALEFTPEAASVLNNASNAHFDAGDAATALKLRQDSLKFEPQNSENWACAGKYLRALGRHAEARDLLQKAIENHPDNAELHIQLAFALLSLGDYPRGFTEFDWRWQGDEISLPEMPIPKWNGQDLAGKSILVTPEQGFGDTILMARFLPALAALGAKVYLTVKQPLRRTFETLDGVHAFATTKADVTKCDYWSPMMDLPRFLGTTLDTLPAPTQLTIPQDSRDRAKAMIAPFANRFKIGVLWSGSTTYRANHNRSFSHTQFLQLADIPNVQMYSLYKGPLADAFHADGTSCIILDAASKDRDFADSAALINELDLVITMDSAIAHVAGSLGAQVWNLLHSEAYWLYEPFPDHTPWYPSMRLVRQEKSGDWNTVFAQLHTDISKLVQQKNA